MPQDRFKTLIRGRRKAKEQTRNSDTAKGVGYRKVRSKYVKGKDGYGKVISELREKLIRENGGKDPGEDTVAMHKYPGTHKPGKGKGNLTGKFGSKSKNTADSNKHRAKK